MIATCRDVNVRPAAEGLADDSAAPAPLVVWQQENLSWRMSGTAPEFALYDDGRLIVRNPAADQDDLDQYLSVVLNEAALERLLDDLAIDETFFQLNDRYDDLDVTDLPEHTIMVRQGVRLKRVTVYGHLEDNDPNLRPSEPAPFLQLFEKLHSYRLKEEAEPWHPERVEIIAHIATAGQTPEPWPEGWPDLDHPDTIQRGEQTYSLFLDWEKFEALNPAHPGGNLYRIDGRSWKLRYNYLFPGVEL